MFDTPVTIVGNVLTAPEWRRTTVTGTFVVSFKVASNSRRFDREHGRWVDGDSLRVRVVCWRRLGENVSLSVQLGDPVIAHGRLYSRDWTDDQGNRRTSYELDAVALGHDLSRGVDKFARRRTVGSTDVVNEPTGPTAIGGEPAEEVESPGRPDDLPPDHELFDNFDPEIFDIAQVATPVSAPRAGEPVAVPQLLAPRPAGEPAVASESGGEEAESGGEEAESGGEGASDAGHGSGGRGSGGRGSGGEAALGAAALGVAPAAGEEVGVASAGEAAESSTGRRRVTRAGRR